MYAEVSISAKHIFAIISFDSLILANVQCIYFRHAEEKIIPNITRHEFINYKICFSVFSFIDQTVLTI